MKVLSVDEALRTEVCDEVGCAQLAEPGSAKCRHHLQLAIEEQRRRLREAETGLGEGVASGITIRVPAEPHPPARDLVEYLGADIVVEPPARVAPTGAAPTEGEESPMAQTCRRGGCGRDAVRNLGVKGRFGTLCEAHYQETRQRQASERRSAATPHGAARPEPQAEPEPAKPPAVREPEPEPARALAVPEAVEGEIVDGNGTPVSFADTAAELEAAWHHLKEAQARFTTASDAFGRHDLIAAILVEHNDDWLRELDEAHT